MARVGPVGDGEIATSEDEALTAGRNGDRHDGYGPDLSDGLHVRNFGIPTVSDAAVQYATTIVGQKVVGQQFRHGVPVVHRELRQVTLGHSACRVFQSRRRLVSSFEFRDRGVEVCLVEYFEAVDELAFDRQKVDRPPLGLEAVRGPIRRVGDKRPKVAQPMHSLNVCAEVRREVPDGTDACGHVTGRESCPAPVVDVHPVRRRCRELAPVVRSVCPCDDRPRV